MPSLLLALLLSSGGEDITSPPPAPSSGMLLECVAATPPVLVTTDGEAHYAPPDSKDGIRVLAIPHRRLAPVMVIRDGEWVMVGNLVVLPLIMRQGDHQVQTNLVLDNGGAMLSLLGKQRCSVTLVIPGTGTVVYYGKLTVVVVPSKDFPPAAEGDLVLDL